MTVVIPLIPQLNSCLIDFFVVRLRCIPHILRNRLNHQATVKTEGTYRTCLIARESSGLYLTVGAGWENTSILTPTSVTVFFKFWVVLQFSKKFNI